MRTLRTSFFVAVVVVHLLLAIAAAGMILREGPQLSRLASLLINVAFAGMHLRILTKKA